MDLTYHCYEENCHYCLRCGPQYHPSGVAAWIAVSFKRKIGWVAGWVDCFQLGKDTSRTKEQRSAYKVLLTIPSVRQI